MATLNRMISLVLLNLKNTGSDKPRYAVCRWNTLASYSYGGAQWIPANPMTTDPPMSLSVVRRHSLVRSVHEAEAVHCSCVDSWSQVGVLSASPCHLFFE